jgi:DNA-binding transcriptional LysR family regulator
VGLSLRRVAITAPPLEVADLIGQRWALTPRAIGPHREWRQMFLDSGIAPPPVAVQTDSVGAMRALVAYSGFLSWLPRALYTFQGSTGLIDILPVKGISNFRYFSVSRRRSGLLSAPTVQFMEELRRVLSEMPHG